MGEFRDKERSTGEDDAAAVRRGTVGGEFGAVR